MVRLRSYECSLINSDLLGTPPMEKSPWPTNRLLQAPDTDPTAAQPKSALLPFLLLLVLLLITLTAVLSLVLLGPRRESRADEFAVPAATEPGRRASLLPVDGAIAPPAPEVLPAPPLPAGPPPTTAIALRGVEITQGIQVFNEPELARCNPDPAAEDNIFCNNSMPLVAGRHTLVRVYLACNGPCPGDEAQVTLRLFKDGQERAAEERTFSAAKLARVSPLPLVDVRAGLANSVNFEFFPPPDWLTGQITFQLEAWPSGETGRPPASLSLTREFAVRKPLRIAYLPIEAGGHQPANPQDAGYWLLRMYPIPGVEYYRLPVPDLVWRSDVTKSELLRQLLFSFWFYAQAQPADQRPDQLFGWLPSEIYNGGASDPFWCPNCAGPHSSRVAFGGLRPESDIGGPRILAHEIAHNLGAQHAWSPTFDEDNACFRAAGADIRVDPAWPYSQTATIQEFGIDLYSDPPVIYPPSFYDMMAYCTRPWISPHTYRKLFNSPFLQPKQSFEQLFTNFSPQVETTPAGTLLITGVIYPNGTVTRPEVLRLDGDAFGSAAAFAPPLNFSPPGQDYCLLIEAKDGRSLGQRCFDAGFIDLETGQPTEPAPFFITLPGINPDDVGRVTLSQKQLQLASVTPSNHPPQVEWRWPRAGDVLVGQQTISWAATDADGDPLTFDLFYSPDGGQRWLPLALRLTETSATFYSGQLTASDAMLLKIIASDGFNTTQLQVGPVSLRPLPANSFSLVGPAAVQVGQTFAVSVVANRVTDPGLFGAQLRLNFDSTLLQAEEMRVNPSFGLVLNQTLDNDAGELAFVASRQGQVDNLTGEVNLATFTFTAQQTGQLYLELFDVKAGARGGLPLPVSELQGLSLTISE